MVTNKEILNNATPVLIKDIERVESTFGIIVKYPSKHLDFLQYTLTNHKTSCYDVMSKFDRCRLGVVKWHGPWRQYVFFPEIEYQTMWSRDCGEDLFGFIKQLMDERKKVK